MNCSVVGLLELALISVVFVSGRQVSALKIAEIPYANLTLQGGPSDGSIDVTGETFALDCLFTAQYDSKLWSPVITFYLNDFILGNFFLTKKSDNTMEVHWDNQELIAMVNVFAKSDLSTVSQSSYSIWVQAQRDVAGKGLYKCSVTLEDSKKYSKARYFSNVLYFE